CIVLKVRQDSRVINKAVFLALGINLDGQKELLGMWLAENEGAKFWLESGCVYGYRKIHLDLRDSGQQYGVNRVWRLMKRIGIKAQVGCRSPRARKGEASIV
ncbi:transposase, partial [Escherichia coli]|uniref:transposase n=1 Tax=Escherichia coli TaxID=562 RepID=UPI003D328513